MKNHGALGLLAMATATFAIMTPAQADTIRLRIGAGHPQVAAWIGTLNDYFLPRVAERVAADTNHTVEWAATWGGSVCKLGECLEAVDAGILDMALLQVAFEPSKLQAHNFTYFVPFGAGDPVVAQKATAAVYANTPSLTKTLEDRYNQTPIGFGIVGNYGLATNFEWGEVAELSGHKIAAAGPNLPWLDGTGAVGVQSTLNEAYTSIQTGVYEGWIMFPDALAAFKLYEVSKQYVELNFGAMHTPLVTVNLEVWQGLPEDVRKIISEVGAEWGVHSAEVIAKKQEAGLVTLEKKGMAVRPSDDEASKTWAENLPNIPKMRADEITGAGLSGEAIYAYIEALKAAGVALPRDWSAER